uniref:Protein cueball n=1 Tax=Diabrotica virgifera virgifera TaxID=50390 RepID=A0A6P7FUE3_DIAVI
MLKHLSFVLFIVGIYHTQCQKLDWDLAVVVRNEIQLLSSTGSVLESRKPFSALRAITYDGIRDQFVVSDTDRNNDTIFTVRLSKETATEPIITSPPGDVQGLAIDPVEDVLYWTKALENTIGYVRLNSSEHIPEDFITFTDTAPHAIAIDVCNRYIYYTNPSRNKPTIERRKLDSTEHQILVNDTIWTPVGLAIDYKNQRLYWADSRIGSSTGRIESISLDGTDRRLFMERNSVQPFGLAVDEEAVYWTDTNNNALYKLLKTETDPSTTPDKIATFHDTPMGLVANFVMNDCKGLPDAIKEYQQHQMQSNQSKEYDDTEEVFQCFNSGVLKNNTCHCKRGFRGKLCEISVCSNDYCLNGDCYLSSSGKPTCNCNKGFIGDRCQKNKCDTYCLNSGECIITSSMNTPTCSCLQGFIGNRCEYNEEICDLYCNNQKDSGFPDEFEIMCRCSYNYSDRNHSSPLQSSLQSQTDILSKFQDPVVYLTVIILVCVVVIIGMLIYIHIVQKKRPRIQKRIIVSKNVTPLTYRPQPNTEQCEITIENCCNMNICETPCFEPTGEDKKKLLMNMEGEDLY